MVIRLRQSAAILLAALALMSFRLDAKPAGTEALYYDVRGAFVTARADVPQLLVTETDRLVNAAIDETVRPTVLPRTVLAVRIDRVIAEPAMLGSRRSATVTVEAFGVGDGEVVAAGSFTVAAFGFVPDSADRSLAERIAERVAREFRLREERRTSPVTALFAGH